MRPTGQAATAQACDTCLELSWLVSRIAPRLERERARIDGLLALDESSLRAALAGTGRAGVERERLAGGVRLIRAGVAGSGLEAVCRCTDGYPDRLRDLEAPPAVLYVLGGLERLGELVRAEPVAIVGTRRASAYGLDVARSLGRSVAAAGLTVISGMALGADAAAHAGALAGGGATIAVLPACAAEPYPRSKRALHEQIASRGIVVSEQGPGSAVWRWSLIARNRIIAGLAAMTVVVEAGERSGALVTSRVAAELGRPVGAVPGRVTSPLAAGPNRLLAGGATLVSGPQDVLDRLYGASVRSLPMLERERLAPELRRLLEAVGEEHDAAAAFTRAGVTTQEGLTALASLELSGHIRRGPGGRYMPVS
ncbi:MAG: DNA-processing protein DprA [Solirubrobacteraceae bacterium]